VEKLNMALTLKGKLVESLDHEQIILDSQSGMSYDKIGEKHGCSKGTIHRVLSYYDCLKYKKQSFSEMTELGKRRGWSCGRPMTKYKGGYPNGFLKRLDKAMQITEDDKVLHLFSGSIQGRENEDTMDIQEKNNPTFLADARETFPMEDNTYDYTISDPPYDLEEKSENKVVQIHYSNPLWETEPIKPYAWLDEAVRVTKPGGFICILHHLVYKTPKIPGTKINSCRRFMQVSVTCGPNTRVRMLSIFQKLTEKEIEIERKKDALQKALEDVIIPETEHEPKGA
tara:strand:- start:32868 stop:33719 length:852 start_codon:yes stop_codon:yes gene_type:complete